MTNAPASSYSFIRTEPARRMRLHDLDVQGDQVLGSMDMGEWCRIHRQPSAGAIGVLVDETVGWAPVPLRQPGTWPVTTELSIDIVGPLPRTGKITCRAQASPPRGRSLHATGLVQDETGDVIAVATTRLRLIDSEVPTPPPAHATLPPTPSGDLLAQMGATLCDHDSMSIAAGSQIANPLGVAHGGVILSAVAVLGQHVLRSRSSELLMSSVHAAYIRAVPVDAVITVQAEVLRSGRAMGVTRVDVIDAQGRLCVAGTVTGHNPNN